MVFLTVACMIRSGGPPRYWKRAMYRRLAWHYFGRKRNCYGISIRYVRRALRYSSQARVLKKKQMKKLWETRISAACQEHGVLYDNFMTTLAQSNIALNRKVLADIAIYEPRSFQSLCQFSKMKSREIGLGAATLECPSGIITRDMLLEEKTKKQYK
ncbi:39S ribosomal protein L20, mitochondrial-like [Gigantopelta aegis]|uniref:39S ribosomal protein L20, mitochondrial-like n=1 Tax=Gigantopelta aegis TaxID=1735272 RepID=UPI001B887808|nr:39S ribosomal protein L20, mitochondrial-like [Gigantopelta aegis]